MARPEKVAVVADVSGRLQESTAAVLTEYRGLSVDELAQLRRQLREENAEYRVVKNTMTRRAAADAGLPIPDEMLTGPTALTLCAGDPIAAAKVLKRFADTHPSLVIKGGVMDGELLDAEQTRGLADLASREELLGKLAGMLGQLLARPAQLGQASLDKLARVLGEHQRKLEAAGETTGSPAEPPPAVEASEPEGASEASGGSDEAAEIPADAVDPADD